MASRWRASRSRAEVLERLRRDLFDGLGAFDWGTVERVTIEPSTDDANATQLHNSLLGVTLSRVRPGRTIGRPPGLTDAGQPIMPTKAAWKPTTMNEANPFVVREIICIRHAGRLLIIS